VDKFSTSSTSLRTQPYSEFIYAHKLWTTFPQQGMAGDNLSNISTAPGDNLSTTVPWWLKRRHSYPHYPAKYPPLLHPYPQSVHMLIAGG